MRHRARTNITVGLGLALVACSSSTAVAPIAAPSHGGSTTPATPVSLAVRPVRDTLRVDSAVQLTDTVRDAQGNLMAGQTIVWKSSAPGVASVSSSGKVTAVAAGSAIITATAGSALGQAAIVVSARDTTPTAPAAVNLAGVWSGDTASLLAQVPFGGCSNVVIPVLVLREDTTTGRLAETQYRRWCGDLAYSDSLDSDTGAVSHPCTLASCAVALNEVSPDGGGLPVAPPGDYWRLALRGSPDTLWNVTPTSLNKGTMPTFFVRISR